MLTIQELRELQRIVSTARLSSYSRYLGTRNASEAYGAYMWSAAISAAFTPLIQAVEVGLRNSLHDTLSSIEGHDWFEKWALNECSYLQSINKLPVGQQSEGVRLINKAKDKIQRRDKARLGHLPRGYVPGVQSVLAELTFGFWVRFLSRYYWDVNNRSKLWPNHLTAVFPGAPSPMYAVGALSNAFNDAVDVRNRIHHQEPLWKNSTVASVDDAILNLSNQLNKTVELLGYLSTDCESALVKYGVIASIQELCTKDAFLRFTGQDNGKHLLLKSAKKDLKLLAKNTKDHQSIWLISDSKSPQLVMRNGNRRYF